MLKLNLRVLLHKRAVQAREHQLLQPAERPVAARQERAQRVQVLREPVQRQAQRVQQELLPGRSLQSARLSLEQVWLVSSVLL
jgi:hypothetical protein